MPVYVSPRLFHPREAKTQHAAVCINEMEKPHNWIVNLHLCHNHPANYGRNLFFPPVSQVSDVAEGIINAIQNPGTDGQVYEAVG